MFCSEKPGVKAGPDAMNHNYMMRDIKGAITHEESQTVMSAFNKVPGLRFVSNDLKPCSGGFPRLHYEQDVFHFLHDRQAAISLDFLGMHPDCTYLTNAGIRWLVSKEPREGYTWDESKQRYVNLDRWKKMELACLHFKSCYSWLQTIGCGYIENPKMHPYAMEIIGVPPSQSVHPYYFGSKQMKETHLWTVGLPDLVADNMLVKPKKGENYDEWIAWQDCWTASPGPKRAEIRSKTDPNVARAMADQWGKYLLNFSNPH